MEQPSFDKTTVEHQYDTLIKKVLIGEAKNARAELKKRRAYEVILTISYTQFMSYFLDRFAA